MYTPLDHWLSGLSWMECPLELRNTYSAAAREHPLFVLDAIFKFASRNASLPWPTYLFVPRTTFAPSLRSEQKSYFLNLVFPRLLDPKEVDRAVDSLADWLSSSPRTHFELAFRGKPLSQTPAKALKALLKEHPALDSKPTSLTLDVLTPLPFENSSGTWKGEISGGALGELLLRRAERLFGEMPEEAKEEEAEFWKTVSVNSYFWNYEEYKHASKSTGGTRYLNGYSGQLHLEGNLARALPLLSLCAHVNVGSRLSAGQGSFCVLPADAKLDKTLFDKAFWMKSWKEAEGARSLALPEDIFERLLAERIGAELWAPWKKPDPLDPVLGCGLHALLFSALSRKDPEAGVYWSASLPRLPKPTGKALEGLVPPQNKRLLRIIELFSGVSFSSLHTPLKDAVEPKAGDRLSSFLHGKAQPVVPSVETSEPVPVRIDEPVRLSLTQGEAYISTDSGSVPTLPLKKVSILALGGRGSVEISLVRTCLAMEIPVVFLSPAGLCAGMTLPSSMAWRSRRGAQQVLWGTLGEEGRNRIAAALLAAKAFGYIDLGKKEGGSSSVFEALRDEALKAAVVDCGEAKVRDLAARLSNEVLEFFLRQVAWAPAFSDAEARERRWTAVLDAVFQIATRWIFNLLQAEGLSSSCAFLRAGSKSNLALPEDIAENFHAVIAAWALRMAKSGAIQNEHFRQGGVGSGARLLTPRAWDLIEREMDAEMLLSANEYGGDSLLVLLSRQVRRIRLWCAGSAPLEIWTGENWWRPLLSDGKTQQEF